MGCTRWTMVMSFVTHKDNLLTGNSEECGDITNEGILPGKKSQFFYTKSMIQFLCFFVLMVERLYNTRLNMIFGVDF